MEIQWSFPFPSIFNDSPHPLGPYVVAFFMTVSDYQTGAVEGLLNN